MVLADRAPDRMMETHVCLSPEATFELGAELGRRLRGGDAVLLHGGLGAGKTLFTKGVLSALDFYTDEVTSPSFTLVNLYRTDDMDVYHIDLWRIDKGSDAAFGVGLDEIVEQENAVVIIEWAERLGGYRFPSRVFEVSIEGSGEGPRRVTITERS